MANPINNAKLSTPVATNHTSRAVQHRQDEAPSGASLHPPQHEDRVTLSGIPAPGPEGENSIRSPEAARQMVEQLKEQISDAPAAALAALQGISTDSATRVIYHAVA